MKTFLIRQATIGAILLVLCSLSLQAAVKDAESATHGYDAASYQIVDTYEFDGFKLIQINLPVLSHYSYFLVSDNKVLVVDPGRDIDFYTDLINKQSLTEDIVKVNDIQQFKPIDQLQTAYAQIIPSKETKVIVHCRTGHQASQTFFVLTRLLNYKDVLWYDAGWSEWAAKQELPIEK